MNKTLEATELWLYIMMLRISRIEHVSNDKFLEKMETINQFIFNI